MGYHFFEDGLAFSEDRIEIYNIYMYKIHKELQREDVRKYFETFGEIMEFRFKAKRSSGFIKFKTAKSAAKALEVCKHKIDALKIVMVKSCETWHQPGGSFVNNTKHSFMKKQTEISKKKEKDNFIIQNLNDDCLFVIFEKLKLKDQIVLACSHERFKNAFQSYAKLYYKSIQAHIFDYLTLWNTRQFFIFTGHCIEKFMCFKSGYIVNFARVHCSSLLTLELHNFNIKKTILKKFLMKNPKLITLILNYKGITEHTIHAVGKLLNLENLYINSDQFTGKFLNCLKGVKRLILFSCSKIVLSHLQKALAVMPNLQYLDIRYLQLSNQFFENLPHLVRNLETIKISNEDLVYENVAKIPNLKNLAILKSFYSPPRIELFHQLVKEKCNQLQVLEFRRLPLNLEHCQLISKLKFLKILNLIFSNKINDQCLGYLSELKNLEILSLEMCINITNDGVFHLVRRCRKLKIVNLQYTKLDNEFTDKIIKEIKQNKRPNGQITFQIARTNINEFSLPQEYKCPEVQKLILFSFEFSMLNCNDFEENFF